MATAEENKAVVRRFLDEGWSRGDMSAIEAVIAPDYAVHDPNPPGRAGGVEGEKQTVRMYRTAFPDLTFTIEDLVAEGDKVVSRFTGRGTHRGELMGVPPSGKQVVVSGIAITPIA